MQRKKEILILAHLKWDENNSVQMWKFLIQGYRNFRTTNKY